MQLILLLAELMVDHALYTLDAERYPFLQYLINAHYTRVAGYENVEVAGKRVLQRSEPEHLAHELVGVLAFFQIEGQLQTRKIGLVAYIRDLGHLAELHELQHLVHDRFNRRGGRYFRYLYAAAFLIEGVFAADEYAAASGFVDLLHLVFIVNDKSAAGEVRTLQCRGNVMLRVFHHRDSSLAYLPQVEGADIACHGHRDTDIVVDENGRELHRKQHRLGEGVVVVRNEVNGVLVDVAEQLIADRVELCLGVTRGCV